jgi:hypothetical protein
MVNYRRRLKRDVSWPGSGADDFVGDASCDMLDPRLKF